MTVSRQCPVCKRPLLSSSRALPFCSEQCRLVDLGRWLGEDYRIAGAAAEQADEAAPRASTEAAPAMDGAPSSDLPDDGDG